MATELHEIVNDYGCPVFASEEFDSLITWNGSSTLLLWTPEGGDALTGEWIPGGYRRPKRWQNTDIQTNYDLTNIHLATKAAKEWHEEMLVETE
jgi:hypothetical protein